MKISEGLKNKIELFIKNQELHLNLDELKELQKFCRHTFRFSVDIHCSDCVGRHAKKVYDYLNKKK